jgi:hypothetical protein
MSAHNTILRLPAPEHVVPARFMLGTVFLILAGAGAILSLVGAIAEPHQFAFSWFAAFYCFFTLCAGALFWVLLHYVCNGSWDILIRRIWENLAALFPLVFVIFLPLILVPQLRDTIWTWMPLSGTHNHELDVRAGYLNLPFFYIRVLGYFAFFIGVSLYYRNNSLKQDATGSPVWAFRCHYHSYFLMTLWALIETFASFDWFMGIGPSWKWSSSLFGAYHFAVCAQAGLAACIVIAAWLQSHGYLTRLNREHYHLAGKLLLGFTILWAYFAFGQFLLIWYANIPEETIFYNDHNRGLWKYLTYFLIVGKFMFPVIYLLAQDTKRNLRGLTAIALWILFMHAVEMYWFVAPYAHAKTLVPSWLDPVTFITVGSILGYAYIRIMSSAALFPYRDPRLPECLTVSN